MLHAHSRCCQLIQGMKKLTMLRVGPLCWTVSYTAGSVSSPCCRVSCTAGSDSSPCCTCQLNSHLLERKLTTVKLYGSAEPAPFKAM